MLLRHVKIYIYVEKKKKKMVNEGGMSLACVVIFLKTA